MCPGLDARRDGDATLEIVTYTLLCEFFYPVAVAEDCFSSKLDCARAYLPPYGTTHRRGYQTRL